MGTCRECFGTIRNQRDLESHAFAHRVGTDGLLETPFALAVRRLREERQSRCSDPQTITFWQCEVERLRP